MLARLTLFLVTALSPLWAEALEDISLPPGFSIEEYADVPNARSLALGDNGTVFVSNRKGRSVYAVVPDGGDTRTIKLTRGMRSNE